MKYFDAATTQKIRKGYFSAIYFSRTKDILLHEKNFTQVTMQVFQRKENAILCGIDEVVKLFKTCSGYFQNKRWVSGWSELTIKTLQDGDRVKNKEPVIHITGPYVLFAHLESIYLGILARRTLVATNIHNIVTAAKDRPVFFFGDRFDHFLNQEGDGYAALIGGATGVCTPAQSMRFGKSPVGTMPHALIAINQGNTIKATQLFHTHFPDVPIVALVDFDNDCVHTALSVAKKFGKKLWGVRIDTSSDVIDSSLQKLKQPKPGVVPELIYAVRKALDKEGFSYVRIIASGGFTKEKIALFEKLKVPVDAYGVGSAVLKGENDFTADVVKVDGKSIAKLGRNYIENKRMKRKST